MTDKTTLARSSQIIGFSLSTPDPNRPPQNPPGPGKPPVKPPGPDKPPVEPPPDPEKPPAIPPGPDKPPVEPPPDPEKPPAIPPGPDKPPVMSHAATANTSVAPTDMAAVELYCYPADTGIAALPVHVLSVARHS